MSIKCLQHVHKKTLSGRLLLGIMSEQKSNMWIQIKTNNNLPHTICYENVIGISLLF